MCINQAHNNYNYNSRPQGISADSTNFPGNAKKPTVRSTTTNQWPLLVLLSTQLMRLNPITNYMRPCHHGLNTIDTNVFPCILFTQQSKHITKVQQTKTNNNCCFHFQSQNCGQHQWPHTQSEQPTRTHSNLNACHAIQLISFQNTTTNQQQTIGQKMFCYQYTVFSPKPERGTYLQIR